MKVQYQNESLDDGDDYAATVMMTDLFPFWNLSFSWKVLKVYGKLESEIFDLSVTC